MASAFFYGILMHPKILKRVLNNDASYLQICPAILTGYSRHKVKSEDYPAIIPEDRSKKVLGRELTAEENRIRGVVVKGLTAEDIKYLDAFEWDTYYNRVDVLVHLLGPFTSVPADTTGSSEAEENSLIPTPTPLASISELARPIEAQTYVWCRDDSELETEPWSFNDFVRERSSRWIGSGSEDHEAYLEVDKLRESYRNHEKTASDEA